MLKVCDDECENSSPSTYRNLALNQLTNRVSSATGRTDPVSGTISVTSISINARVRFISQQLRDVSDTSTSVAVSLLPYPGTKGCIDSPGIAREGLL